MIIKKLIFSIQNKIYACDLDVRLNFNLDKAFPITLQSEGIFTNLPALFISNVEKDIYAQSPKSYEDFYFECLNGIEKEVFSGFILLTEKEELIGFLNFKSIFEIIEIEYINVNIAQRSKGYGQLIIYFLSKIINKYMENYHHKIILEVGENNKGAYQLYCKNGFQKISTRKKYYKNSDNAIVMEKIL